MGASSRQLLSVFESEEELCNIRKLATNVEVNSNDECLNSARTCLAVAAVRN